MQRDGGTSPRPKSDCGRPPRPCHHSLIHHSSIFQGTPPGFPGTNQLPRPQEWDGAAHLPSLSVQQIFHLRHISQASMGSVSARSLLAQRRNPRALKDNTCLKHLKAGQR